VRRDALGGYDLPLRSLPCGLVGNLRH
jgi:hypothetical protein